MDSVKTQSYHSDFGTPREKKECLGRKNPGAAKYQSKSEKNAKSERALKKCFICRQLQVGKSDLGSLMCKLCLKCISKIMKLVQKTPNE